MASKYDTVGGIDDSGMYGMLAHWRQKVGPTGFSSRSTAEQVCKDWDGSGKVAIVTGASTGLGLESSRVLALHGCDVIMAGRDMPKLKAAAEGIRQQQPNAKVTPMQLDLASLKSVEAFAKEFAATGKPLNILLENAGVMACPFMLTEDGHEMQFGTNHLGHFLLTQLLLPNMVATAKEQGLQGRIVCVSSLAHIIMGYKDVGIRMDKIDSPEGYNAWKAYGQSKLCNVLFARELNQRLKAQGANVVAVSLHPGNIQTELQRHMYIPAWVHSMLSLMMRPAFKSIPQGAATQVYCCTAPTVSGGEYYTDVNVYPSHSWAHDKQLGERLWAHSENLCKEYLK